MFNLFCVNYWTFVIPGRSGCIGCARKTLWYACMLTWWKTSLSLWLLLVSVWHYSSQWDNGRAGTNNRPCWHEAEAWSHGRCYKSQWRTNHCWWSRQSALSLFSLDLHLHLFLYLSVQVFVFTSFLLLLIYLLPVRPVKLSDEVSVWLPVWSKVQIVCMWSS